ncbi:unnamed protein product [Auanema sp. JU1783]|nr:unnamed protein product [Auanema sp. JU1783]
MSEKLLPGTLCAVCEDLATGNHYSVPSCNGCKTFFRRALVNKKEFVCLGKKNCPVNKGVRCACRYCRLQKCLLVGMDKNSIQGGRDRIGYTKRTRKNQKSLIDDDIRQNESSASGSCSPSRIDYDRNSPPEIKDLKLDFTSYDPMLERLTMIENNFTLLLSRGEVEPYSSLDEALAAPSKLNGPLKIKGDVEQIKLKIDSDQQPYWRSRIIALYIDWAKTFSAFRNLPYADKVALITNHASSYMILCEAFRTPEHIDEGKIENCINMASSNPMSASGLLSVVLNDSVARSFANTLELKTKVKKEPSNNMIRLPTEYGSLPADYGTWIPPDYGHTLSMNGKSELQSAYEACKGSCKNKNGESFDKACIHHNKNAGVLTSVMAAMIDYILKPFRQLNVSTTEFATLQAIMFFDPDTNGIDAASQRNIAAEQKRLLTALHRHLLRSYDTQSADERFANILLRIPSVRKVAAKKNESLQMIDMLNLFSINSLVRETALGIRPSTSTASSMNGGGTGYCTE